MKTIKVQLTSDTLKQNCPFCDRENNFKFGDVCLHVDRVTVKRIVIYKSSEIVRIWCKDIWIDKVK